LALVNSQPHVVAFDGQQILGSFLDRSPSTEMASHGEQISVIFVGNLGSPDLLELQ